MAWRFNATIGGLAALAAVATVVPAHATSPSGNGSSVSNQADFDRDKVTLKDQTQASIDAAGANIDALKRLSGSESGQTKKQHQDMTDKISTLRGHLTADLGKIDKASANDWPGVRPVVERDLSAMNAELESAAPVTNVQPPPR